MSDDFVYRLRRKDEYLPLGHDGWEAADRIESLTAENERLRKALALYSCEDGCNDCPVHERDQVGCGWTARQVLATIAELKGEKNEQL